MDQGTKGEEQTSTYEHKLGAILPRRNRCVENTVQPFQASPQKDLPSWKYKKNTADLVSTTQTQVLSATGQTDWPRLQSSLVVFTDMIDKHVF